MGKLSKSERKKLKRLRREEELNVVPENTKKKFRLSRTRAILFKIFLVVLAFGIYANSLNNQITLVDDYQSFTQNETIRSLSKSIKSMYIQHIVYALSYANFGESPFPLRAVAVTLHILTVLVVFSLFRRLINDKAGIIVSLIFATHPINTEAVTWISGVPYVYYGLFTFILMYLLLLYRRTNEVKYAVWLVVVYIMEIVFMKGPWVLVPPIALAVFDIFFLSKSFNYKRLNWLFIFLIPIGLYMVIVFKDQLAIRTQLRDGINNRVAINQQKLIPVIQGYPYSTYSFIKLYLFPKDLTVYYDGIEIRQVDYVLFYLSFLVYAGAVIYSFKKNRKIFGSLIMLPILVAPVYSPIKITWFMAERYLYTGTAFFGLLIYYLMEYVNSKINKERFVYFIFFIILVLYSVRTVIRNNDWQDTETLSLANIKVSPLSVRPYNDLGSYYYFNGDINKAVEWYENGLRVYDSSGTAMNNLGLIYMQKGPLVFWEDLEDRFILDFPADALFLNAQKNEKQGELRAAAFLMNQGLAKDPTHVDGALYTADFYVTNGLPEYAVQIYELVLESDPDNDHAIRVLSLLESR